MAPLATRRYAPAARPPPAPTALPSTRTNRLRTRRAAGRLAPMGRYGEIWGSARLSGGGINPEAAEPAEARASSAALALGKGADADGGGGGGGGGGARRSSERQGEEVPRGAAGGPSVRRVRAAAAAVTARHSDNALHISATSRRQLGCVLCEGAPRRRRARGGRCGDALPRLSTRGVHRALLVSDSRFDPRYSRYIADI